jgi:hypothetical protein
MTSSPRQKARVYPMRANVARIIESILVIVADAKERRTSVTQYDVVKAVFIADRRHLNKYGRPITYDNYVAMRNGPVPSLTYDFLKGKKLRLAGTVPWSRREAPELGEKCYAYEAPARMPDENILSPSDMMELKAALTVVKELGFTEIKRLTHGDQAFIDAWETEGDGKQYPMSYALLFDVPSDEKAAELSFFSEHI